jgi:pimeloyl-ACP methyl ester carboxylesterase
MKRMISVLIIIGLYSFSYSQTPNKAETVKLNGVETYYEVYGEGEPLFLLHGITQSTTIWNEYVTAFTDNNKVYLVDIKGHGKSSPILTEFSLQAAVDDFLALLDYLELDAVKAIGFSYGAELLLQLCSTDSHRIKSMIIIGAEYDFNGKELNLNYEEFPTEWLLSTRKHSIHGETQVKALIKLLNNYEIHLSNEQLSTISTSTLLIYGENDDWFADDLNKIVNLHNNLPDSHIWVVPNKGHKAFAGNNKPEFIRIANEFLSGEWQ